MSRAREPTPKLAIKQHASEVGAAQDSSPSFYIDVIQPAAERWTSAARAQARNLTARKNDESHAIAGRLQGLVRCGALRNHTALPFHIG